jgi:hypothetical protein
LRSEHQPARGHGRGPWWVVLRVTSRPAGRARLQLFVNAGLAVLRLWQPRMDPAPDPPQPPTAKLRFERTEGQPCAGRTAVVRNGQISASVWQWQRQRQRSVFHSRAHPPAGGWWLGDRAQGPFAVATDPAFRPRPSRQQCLPAHPDAREVTRSTVTRPPPVPTLQRHAKLLHAKCPPCSARRSFSTQAPTQRRGTVETRAYKKRHRNASRVVLLTSSITAYVRVSRTPGSCHSTVPAN